MHSSKGQHGVYRLARAAYQISLAEVIRLFDGALAPTESVSKNFYEPTLIEKEKNLVLIFKDIRDYISNKLETSTLVILLKGYPATFAWELPAIRATPFC